MDSEYEERVLSILHGRKGWDEELSSISGFKQQLEEADDLAHEKLRCGWVFRRENEIQLEQHQILTLLKYIASESWSTRHHYLVQLWGVVKVKGRNHHLSTSNYPFCVGKLSKGICWYRNRCRGLAYVVGDDDDDHDDEEQHQHQQQQLIGGVGRAYRKKLPESTPDLRLYSTNEFPMQDEAARCGFICYLALPLFHRLLGTSECYGVLEFLLGDTLTRTSLISTLDGALKIAGFRSTHTSVSISGFATKKKPEIEIRERLELAMATVPRLYLALVWVPSKHQCYVSTNSRCMEISSYNMLNPIDSCIYDYFVACQLHHLRIDVSSLDSSVGDDLSISKNPLSHYAQRYRINMSHSFAVSLQSLNNTDNHLYVIQFFLQPKPKSREDDAGDYSRHLLSRIMEMNSKTFKIVSWGRLVSESQKLNAIDQCESTDRLNVMESYKQNLLKWDITTYLKIVNSCCLRPSPEDSSQGWVFGINSNSLLVSVLIKEKIETFMKNIQFLFKGEYWIIQFWAPKMVEDRCYLQAFDQPYVVGCLANGLASYRMKCTRHSYRVDDGAKEEELGPPGRVFRNRYPEVTPDFFYYTTNEFPIRNDAMHCCTTFGRGYLALPIFNDEHHHICDGVLEFVGISHLDLNNIRRELEAAKLCSTHTALHPRFSLDEPVINTIYYSSKALNEVRNALRSIHNIPQLYMANVWVPNGECVTSINSNTSCMGLAFSTLHTHLLRQIHVQPGKGMVGMVLASENKSCFCRNLCEFSIVDQPLSHFEMSRRCEVCFAICLQSSHTGDLVYVVEFFFNQGPATYEYLRLFLNILIPIMKHELKSFKIASGKQLGEELVVDVIEFSDANVVDSSNTEETYVFPIKFRSVQYSQKEHQHSEEQQTEENNVVVEHQHSEEQQSEECSVAVGTEEQQTEKCSVAVEHQHIEEEQQTEECNVAVECQHTGEQQTEERRVAASGSKTRERGKRKTGLNLSLEVLKSHFGKKLEDVAEELGIGKSTIKRACRGYGIDRWPKNSSLFEREYAQQDILPSTSNLQPLDSSLHRNVPHANTEEKVMIKVKYEEDIIKFELCLSLGFDKVIEEVGTRLNLEKGAFKLKYLDEDGDEILLTNDADLQLCGKTHITMNKTYIQLFVR